MGATNGKNGSNGHNGHNGHNGVGLGFVVGDLGEVELEPVVELKAPPGFVPCDACGKPVSRREKGDYFAVHFAKLTDLKPCLRSWPPKIENPKVPAP